MRSRVSRGVLVLLFPVALAAGGCGMSLGNLTGRATDQWTHTYPLAPGGEIRIVNTNGKIDVAAVDGNTLEVTAERIAVAKSAVLTRHGARTAAEAQDQRGCETRSRVDRNRATGRAHDWRWLRGPIPRQGAERCGGQRDLNQRRDLARRSQRQGHRPDDESGE